MSGAACCRYIAGFCLISSPVSLGFEARQDLVSLMADEKVGFFGVADRTAPHENIGDVKSAQGLQVVGGPHEVRIKSRENACQPDQDETIIECNAGDLGGTVCSLNN